MQMQMRLANRGIASDSQGALANRTTQGTDQCLPIWYCFDDMLVTGQDPSNVRCVYARSTMTNDQQLAAVVHAGVCRGSVRHAAVPLPKHTGSVTHGQQVTQHNSCS